MGYSILIDSTKGDIFKHIMQELNGHEEALVILTNTPANRTLISTNRDVSIKWGDTEIFTGLLTGADYGPGKLECKVYNKAFIAMEKHLITDEYANIAANSILDDILEQDSGTTTANGNVSGTTVVDTNQTESDNFFIYMYLKITSGAQSGQIRLIVNWIQSTGTFSVWPAFGGQILSGVTYRVFYVKPGSCPATSISVIFKKATCLNAARFIADAVNKDHWSESMLFNIGTRGSAKGSIVVTGFPKRGVDRAKQRNHVWVRGYDTDGATIWGEAKSGGWTAENDNPIVINEHKATDTATLDNIAAKALELQELESSGVKLEVSPDVGYYMYPGDTVTLARPDLKLVGDFRIWKITKKLTTVSVEVDRPEMVLEQQLEKIFNYEEMGIYVPTGICTATCQTQCQVACQTECQPACQQTCQDSAGCQTSCQATCQLECQPTCQTACQDTAGCQTVCQETDQTCAKSGNCQVACQQTCQQAKACESGGVCQTACQSGHTCETTCQEECQDSAGCQVACQAACQTQCQPTCQTECQDGAGCQVACQASCQIQCQPTCQTACQDTAGCQTTCQASDQTCAKSGNCQSACQQSCQGTATCETVCQTVAQSPAPPENLLFNGGFEDDIDGNNIPDFWELVGSDPPAWTTTDPDKGGHHIRFSITGGSGLSGSAYSEKFVVRGSKKYFISTRQKYITGSDQMRFVVHWYRKDKTTWIEGSPIMWLGTNPNWTTISSEVTSHADARYAQVEIYMYQPATSITIYIDDVYFSEQKAAVPTAGVVAAEVVTTPGGVAVPQMSWTELSDWVVPDEDHEILFISGFASLTDVIVFGVLGGWRIHDETDNIYYPSTNGVRQSFFGATTGLLQARFLITIPKNVKGHTLSLQIYCGKAKTIDAAWNTWGHSPHRHQ